MQRHRWYCILSIFYVHCVCDRSFCGARETVFRNGRATVFSREIPGAGWSGLFFPTDDNNEIFWRWPTIFLQCHRDGGSYRGDRMFELRPLLFSVKYRRTVSGRNSRVQTVSENGVVFQCDCVRASIHYRYKPPTTP